MTSTGPEGILARCPEACLGRPSQSLRASRRQPRAAHPLDSRARCCAGGPQDGSGRASGRENALTSIIGIVSRLLSVSLGGSLEWAMRAWPLDAGYDAARFC